MSVKSDVEPENISKLISIGIDIENVIKKDDKLSVILKKYINLVREHLSVNKRKDEELKEELVKLELNLWYDVAEREYKDFLQFDNFLEIRYHLRGFKFKKKELNDVIDEISRGGLKKEELVDLYKRKFNLSRELNTYPLPIKLNWDMVIKFGMLLIAIAGVVLTYLIFVKKP